jgi:hypothetical protein
MRVVLFILLIIALAAVNAEVGGSSALKAPATARALKRAKAVKESPVQVVGAAVKAAPAFDGKAALQLATTFAIWYGFNAACKYPVHWHPQVAFQVKDGINAPLFAKF